jgi:hypothetical protein
MVVLSLTSTVVIGCTTATREGLRAEASERGMPRACDADDDEFRRGFASVLGRQYPRSAAGPTNVQQHLPSSASTTDTLSSIRYIPSTYLRRYQRTHKRPAAKQTTFFPQNNQKTNTKQTIKNGCPRRCPCEFSAELIIRVQDDEILELTQFMNDSWVNRPVFSLVSRPGSCSSTLVRTR